MSKNRFVTAITNNFWQAVITNLSMRSFREQRLGKLMSTAQALQEFVKTILVKVTMPRVSNE